RIHHGVALEESEKLLATFVFVDASDVDREWTLDVELLPETPGLRAIRDRRSDADDHTRTLPRAHALDERALLERVVHDRPRTAEQGRENSQPDGRIALGCRHEHRFLRHGADAVPRVV